MEHEGDVVIYDFEFEQDGRNFEADIREDGTIHNWEQQVAVRDLPRGSQVPSSGNTLGRRSSRSCRSRR
jgi:hypothetical protein